MTDKERYNVVSDILAVLAVALLSAWGISWLTELTYWESFVAWLLLRMLLQPIRR